MKRRTKNTPARTKAKDAPAGPVGGWPIRFNIPDDAKIKTIPTPTTEAATTGKHFWGVPDMRPICESGAQS